MQIQLTAQDALVLPVIRHKMTNNTTGETVLTGKTMHCFTNHEGKPIILKKQFPEFDQELRSLAAENQK